MIDILMITHNRPEYTRLSLPHLLDLCDESMRVWVWHNGNHAETLEVVRAQLDHPRLFRFHHSPENKRLVEPTNWVWREGQGEFVAKVDDDCLQLDGWPRPLIAMHRSFDRFGALGSWEFKDTDVVPALAEKKIRTFAGGHRLMQNPWVSGTGYVMKRRCIEEQGFLKPGASFPQYLIDLAMKGWVHGWPFPLVRQENLDDPRSAHTRLRTNADLDLGAGGPLTARYMQCTTLEQWIEQIQRMAFEVQAGPVEAKYYRGWRALVRRARRRVRLALGLRP